MPLYDPDHIEYSVTTGHVQIVLDDGSQLPAYFAHPSIGRKFPGAAIIHDWWGLTDIVRRVANLFAQMGHYVMVPDLFNGQIATTPRQAIQLVEGLVKNGYPGVHNALGVLETHHQCNGSVAAVGIGMGGSLAFEAAIIRTDIEAAVAYSGFPQRYFGRFKDAHAPICAFYGEQEPHITSPMVQKLQKELAQSTLKNDHKVVIVPELGHEFFSPRFNDAHKERSRQVLKETFEFLDNHLAHPKKPTRKIY